jgi:hypothetical protein
MVLRILRAAAKVALEACLDGYTEENTPRGTVEAIFNQQIRQQWLRSRRPHVPITTIVNVMQAA